VTLITAAPRRRRPWGRLHGAVAVAALLLSGLDQLISAVTGWPPLAYACRRAAAPIAAVYRAASSRPSAAPPVVTIYAVPLPTERNHDDGITSR
jgi:hypothetical protein